MCGALRREARLPSLWRSGRGWARVFGHVQGEHICTAVFGGSPYGTASGTWNGSQSPDVLLYSNVPSIPSVTVIGPEWVGYDNDNCLWQSQIQGGREPYTFRWSGLKTGSSSGIWGPFTQAEPCRWTFGMHWVSTPYLTRFMCGWTQRVLGQVSADVNNLERVLHSDILRNKPCD